jgi:hypothetical protein
MSTDDMDDYLSEVLDIESKDLRAKIIREGFKSLDILVKKDQAWCKQLRLSIKKSSGNAASKDITIEHEEGLVMTMLWAKLR